MANRVRVNMLQYCSVSNFLSYTTLSNKVRDFSKELCCSSLLCRRCDYACIWVYNKSPGNLTWLTVIQTPIKQLLRTGVKNLPWTEHCWFFTPPRTSRMWHKVDFKQSLRGLKSEFSFSKNSCHIEVKEPMTGEWFPMSISTMWNAINLVQDLNSCHLIHFLRQ